MKGANGARMKVLLPLLAFAATVCAAAELTSSAALAPSGGVYFSSEGKGTVSYDSSTGWYTYTPAPLPDDTTVTINVELANVAYRAFNQFWVEWDNQNDSTAMRFSLLRALPAWDEVKTDVVVAARGKSSTDVFLGGIGAPAKLRGMKAVIYHRTSSYANSSAASPVRFRARLKMTDYNLPSTLWNSLAAAQEQAISATFSAAAKAAGEAKRAELRAETSSLRQAATASGTSGADRIAAYESLFTHRDDDARAIEKAALAVEAAEKESAGGILHGVISGADKVSRDAPFKGDYGASARLSVARGEAEGVQVALYPSRALAGVVATVSPLVTSSGIRLPASCVTVAPVGYVRPTYPAYVAPSVFRETVPDPIMDWASSLNLEAERFQPYWIEAKIPAGTSPGLYSGSVTFTSASGCSVSVPLSVKVRRFALPRHRSLPVVFSSNVFSAQSDLQIVYERDASVLSELAGFLASEGGDPSVLSPAAFAAWTRAKQEYDLLVSHNLPYQNIYCNPSTVQPKWIRDMRLRDCPSIFTIGYDKVSPSVDVVGEHVSAMGDKSSSIWFYGYDEVSSASAFAGMKKSFGSVKAAYPQVKTFCTALDGTFGETSDCREEVDAWVDPEDRFAGSGHQANAAKARARGKQVWFYPCNWPVIPWANYHLENSAVASRVLAGAAAWKKKTDGVLYYGVDAFTPYMDTSIINYGFDTFSGGAKKTRLGNSGWDRDITITTTSSSNTGKAERWESFADSVDKLPAVRIRGQVYVNNFTKSSGYGCYVELRFNYVDKSLGDNGQEQNFYNVNVGKTKQWQTIDMTVTPKGEAVNCLFRVYAKSSNAKVIFRDVRVEYADGHTVNRKLGASAPLSGSSPVFEDACYGSFRSNGDGSLIYPGANGPAASLRLKYVRDGIDDYEYLRLLGKAVAAVRSGRVAMAGETQFLARADAALAVPAEVCSSFTSYAEEGRTLVAWRDEMGDLLDAFCDAARARGKIRGVVDSFETFPGASGDTVAGFPGDDACGRWSTGFYPSNPGNGVAFVVKGDGEAAHGGAYLRIADISASQHSVTKSIDASRRLRIPNPTEAKLLFAFSFRRIPVDASGALTGCKLKLSAVSTLTGETIAYTDGADMFNTPSSIASALSGTGVWCRVSGHLRLETPSAGKRRLALRLNSISECDSGKMLYYSPGEGMLYSYKDRTSVADDFFLSELTFFTFSGSKAYVDIDDIAIGRRSSEATTLFVM